MKLLLILAAFTWQGQANFNDSYYDLLQPGEIVWTEAGSEGEVQGSFPDGRVSVKIGYGSFTFQRSQLAVRGCVAHLCSGTEVITTAGSQGTVNGVFPDRRLSVKIGYGNFVFRYEQLASGEPPYRPGPPHRPYPPRQGELRAGDTVWTRSGSEGTVNGLFPSGEVSVKIGYGNFKFGRDQLAVRGCFRHLCSGDSVITRAGSRGTVNGVFQGSAFSVKIGYGNFVFDYSDLAETLP